MSSDESSPPKKSRVLNMRKLESSIDLNRVSNMKQNLGTETFPPNLSNMRSILLLCFASLKLYLVRDVSTTTFTKKITIVGPHSIQLL